jgi:hypothetical protein
VTAETTLLLANAFATWYMVGVIWFVQLVHYPLMAAFDRAHFQAHCLTHQTRTSYVVGPAMVVESITAALLLIWCPPNVPLWLPWLGFALVWPWILVTAFVSIPIHDRLVKGGFDEVALRRLVRTNWIRTIAWTGRGLFVYCMMAKVFSGAAPHP